MTNHIDEFDGCFAENSINESVSIEVNCYASITVFEYIKKTVYFKKTENGELFKWNIMKQEFFFYKNLRDVNFKIYHTGAV